LVYEGHYSVEVNSNNVNTTLSTAITLSAHISLRTIEGELFNSVYAVGNCSELLPTLFTITAPRINRATPHSMMIIVIM
jgi:hypothetical protein